MEMAGGMCGGAWSQAHGAAVSFFFFFFKKTTIAGGEWIETDMRAFWASQPASGTVRGRRTP
jgi:hypothetical protein